MQKLFSESVGCAQSTKQSTIEQIKFQNFNTFSLFLVPVLFSPFL